MNRDRVLIIDFYATWCGPCVLLAKELEEVRCAAACWRLCQMQAHKPGIDLFCPPTCAPALPLNTRRWRG